MLPLGAIYRGIQGFKQGRKAKEMEKGVGKRPDYIIPQGVKTELAMNQGLMNQTMDDTTRQRLTQLDSNASNAARTSQAYAKNAMAGLASAGALLNQSNTAQDNVLADAGQNRRLDRQNYLNSLRQDTTYNEKKQQDQLNQYQERLNAYNAVKKAAMENTAQAVDKTEQWFTDKQGQVMSLVSGGLMGGGGGGGAPQGGGGGGFSTGMLPPQTTPTTFNTNLTSGTPNPYQAMSQGLTARSQGWGFNKNLMGTNPFG